MVVSTVQEKGKNLECTASKRREKVAIIIVLIIFQTVKGIRKKTFSNLFLSLSKQPKKIQKGKQKRQQLDAMMINSRLTKSSGVVLISWLSLILVMQRTCAFSTTNTASTTHFGGHMMVSSSSSPSFVPESKNIYYNPKDSKLLSKNLNTVGQRTKRRSTSFLLAIPTTNGEEAITTATTNKEDSKQEQNSASTSTTTTTTTQDGQRGEGRLGELPGGRTITNKDTVFDEIDNALGVSSPPDIEVILTDHLTYLKNPITKFLHLNVMRFGHLAIRYTTSDGEQHIMNIQGNFVDENATMVNFFSPSEYFYGTDPEVSQQGGPYNRPFVGVRIEKVAKGATDALHAYFQSLQKASEIGGNNDSKIGAAPGSSSRGAVRFQLVEVNLSKLAREVPAPLDKLLYNIADWIRSQDDKRKYATRQMMQNPQNEMQVGMNEVRSAIYHAGNCAQWTSGGLDFVGLIRRPRLFPKAVLIDLLEDEYLKNKRYKNVNVVYYDEIKHAAKRDDDYACIKEAMVHPLKPTWNSFYDNMKEFANIVVEVPEGSETAIVRKQTPTKRPEQWLNYVSATATYVPAAIMLGLLPQIGMLGPTGAAAWLAASWLLY